MIQTLDGLRPGEAIERIGAASLLTKGIVAFVAIRAPAGLSQGVVFEWWHRGERLDSVPALIQGGSNNGWRTFTRKQNFPADPRGRWRVDVLTPQGQLICRLPFVVDDVSRPATQPTQAPIQTPSESPSELRSDSIPPTDAESSASAEPVEPEAAPSEPVIAPAAPEEPPPAPADQTPVEPDPAPAVPPSG
jgi:hypothetical protein